MVFENINSLNTDMVIGKDIIDTVDANTAVDKLVELALPNLEVDDKKNLKDLGLLPKSIKFVNNLRDKDDNEALAEVNTSSKEVKVSQLWLNMFDGIEDFATHKDFYRKQAIRKLIHEQIHIKIAEGNKEEILKQIKDIYNEFKDYVNTLKGEEKENLSTYLFENKKNEDERIEEFLVESFTSKILAEKLNQIEAKWEGVIVKKDVKKTLWDKIIKLIASIFDYISYRKDGKPNTKFDIKKESLLKKELYALAGALNTEAETNIEEKNGVNIENNLSNETDNQLNLEDELDDDMDLDNVSDGFDMFSIAIENIVPNKIESAVQTHSSTTQFIMSLNADDKVKVAELIETGDLNIVCKI